MPRDCTSFFLSKKKKKGDRNERAIRIKAIGKWWKHSLSIPWYTWEIGMEFRESRQTDSLRATGNARFHKIPTYGFPMPTWMRRKPTLNARFPTRSCLGVVWKRDTSAAISGYYKKYMRKKNYTLLLSCLKL